MLIFPSAITNFILLLFVLPCVLCIFHISVICVCCFLLSKPLGSVLMCLPWSLADCLELFGEHLEAQRPPLHICCNKFPKLCDMMVFRIVIN